MKEMRVLSQIPEDSRPLGYGALVEKFKLSTLPLNNYSFSVPHGRKRKIGNSCLYPPPYIKGEDTYAHLGFALKHEGVELEVIAALIPHLKKEEFLKWISKHPKSIYRRKFWFLYEWLSGEKLPLPDLNAVSYIPILDPQKYYTSKPNRSSRHAVLDNFLGNPQFCPMVRKTTTLSNYENLELGKRAVSVAKNYDKSTLSRALHYLFTKETLSSFAIEKDKPSQSRTERFVMLLKEETGKLDKQKLIELQRSIVDPRFADQDYRDYQNYIGEEIGPYRQKIHYITPKPKNVLSLMGGLFKSLERCLESDVHPVIAAAAIAFGFVFIHPFGDGNGRIHRFLIHYILSKMHFVPKEFIFPVSAVMLRNPKDYDSALENFSSNLMQCISNYSMDELGQIEVKEETGIYYQFVDYTSMAEYLFHCVERTIERDLPEELDFLIAHDKASAAVKEIVDMPNRLVELIIRCTLQNGGKVAKRKRDRLFPMLTDIEIEKIESAVNVEFRNNVA